MWKEIEKIANLEWANYAATLPVADVTPGLEVVLREEVVLNSSALFPTPDANHACLLRAAPTQADALIEEVIGYFRDHEVVPTIYLSPACEPTDLPGRLKERGFVEEDEKEAWMVLDLEGYEMPTTYPGVEVRRIAPKQALTFAQVFLRAFEMPEEYAPAMAQLLAPSIGLQGTYHYLAFANNRPIGTMSLLSHKEVGILGSAGVVSMRRGRGAATNLAVTAARQAQDMGIRYLVLQTTAGTLLERFLRISGFERAFTRSCYVLP
ncbi:MAG: GNAT family N-acetyltransferase [Anaerolineae bacterium]